MATSGVYSFSLNKTQMLDMAFQMINLYDLGHTAETDDYNFASNLLNLMLLSWPAEGINLWKRRQATLFTQSDQYSYNIGSVAGSDRATNSYVSTTTSAASVLSATEVIVTDTTGFEDDMNIGIELDDGSRFWTTITNVSGSTISLTDPLTDTVAASNTVVAYEDLINRPLQILRATTIDLNNGGNECKLQDISYDEYFDMPIKTSTGRPCNFYYDRLVANALPYSGVLYLYPQPSDVSTLVNFTYQDSIQEMLNSSNTGDFPQEWMYPVIMCLAADLCIPYGKATELQLIGPKAEALKAQLKLFDSDNESLSILPDDLTR